MYITSDPQAGASVSSAPSKITVTFSQPLDSSSQLQVVDQCAHRVDDHNVQITLNQISVGLRGMAPKGRYVVNYIAVGPQGLTGATRNGFTFTVTSGMQCGMKMNMGGGSSMHGGGHMGGMNGMGSMHESPSHHMGMSMSAGQSHGSMTMQAMTMSGSSMSGDMNRAHAAHGMHGMHMGGMHMGGNRQPPPEASGELSAFDLRPGGTMALVALGLAGALGGLGGIVLRLSA